MVSCTRFLLYKFLARNTAQLYSIQETCMHVTRMVSADWSAAYRCHVFFCCVDVVDNFFTKLIQCVVWFIFLTYLSYSSKHSVFPWSGRQNVLRKLFVSSKNARFYLMCRQPNLHELARNFDARNLRKFLVQVSCTSFLTVCHHHYCSLLVVAVIVKSWIAGCDVSATPSKALMQMVSIDKKR